MLEDKGKLTVRKADPEEGYLAPVVKVIS